MIRSAFTLLLTLVATTVSAQSLSDLARQADAQRKGQAAKSYTAKDLPGPRRIDSTLGEFVMTEALVSGYRRAEVALAKARSAADLDHWLTKCEHESQTDPFGMIDSFGQDKRLAKVFTEITPHDYVFVQVAMSRARNDLLSAKTQRVFMPKPRLANVEFVEQHEGSVGPAPELEQELQSLEAARAKRQPK